jgi:hypothetical protein
VLDLALVAVVPVGKSQAVPVRCEMCVTPWNY